MYGANYEQKDDGDIAIFQEPKGDYGKIGTNKQSKSLPGRELNFKYQLIKGRIAENLIQELFLSEGYQVYKYGIENTHPTLLQQIKGDKGESEQTSLSLRITPDLVIFDPEVTKVYYAEVKFCGNGKFDLHRNIKVEEYRISYPGTLFFILTLDGFFVVDFDVFTDSRILDLTDKENQEKYRLHNAKRFNLRPNSIEKFEEMATLFFSDLQSTFYGC